MKKFAIVLTAIVTLFTATAFAGAPENVTPVVKAGFEKDFSKAKFVSWEKSSDFYFASFKLGSINVEAAYNEEGELLGTSRRIELSQLPLNVNLALEARYRDYVLPTHALELTFEGSTHYYVNVNNGKQELRLKSDISGEIEVEKKIKL